MKRIEVAKELLKNTTSKAMQNFIKAYIKNIEDINQGKCQNKEYLRFDNCMTYIEKVNFNIMGWKLFEIPIFYSHCFYNDKLQQAFDLAVWDIAEVEVRYLKDANECKSDTIDEAIKKYDISDYIAAGNIEI